MRLIGAISSRFGPSAGNELGVGAPCRSFLNAGLAAAKLHFAAPGHRWAPPARPGASTRSVMKPQLAVLYEHPKWFEPLFAALERRGVSYEAIRLSDHSFD